MEEKKSELEKFFDEIDNYNKEHARHLWRDPLSEYTNYTVNEAKKYAEVVLYKIAKIASNLRTNEGRNIFNKLVNRYLNSFYRELEFDRFDRTIKRILDMIEGYFIAKEEGYSLDDYARLVEKENDNRSLFVGEFRQNDSYIMARIVELCEENEKSDDLGV